jgi:hypothetical protein
VLRTVLVVLLGQFVAAMEFHHPLREMQAIAQPLFVPLLKLFDNVPSRTE